MPWIWQTAQWPHFIYDPAQVETPLARAADALGEISGLQQGLTGEECAELHLRQIVQETVASFGIEGVTLDTGQLEQSVVASLRHRDRAAITRRSDAIAQLMQDARAARTPLNGATLQGWHRLLFFGIEVEDPGQWRQSDLEIVRSAAAGHHDVLFVPPPPASVAGEMDRFFHWLDGSTTLPTPIRAGLAHLWFETIHPFSDGNGRIGRALIEHVFARSRALPFSLSRQIETEKRAYYDALQAGRRETAQGIDATAFLVWFLECLTRAASLARTEARFLIARNQYFMRFATQLTARQNHVLRRLFDQGPHRVAEGISARSYAKIAGVSAATATRDLTALADCGAIVRSETGGRSTFYRLDFGTGVTPAAAR